MFGQKPWTIPFGKSRCFTLSKNLYCWSKIVLFYPEYQKTIFSDLISPKNTNRKYFDFWPKKWIISLEKTIFADLLKLQFSGLKFNFFYPEYPETIFSNITSSKTLMRKSLNFGQKPWTNLLEKGRFFGAPQNVTFLL